MKKFTLKVSGRSFVSPSPSQTTRNDTKFHTKYKFAYRLSGWDGLDPDAAPSQIHTIDALFKNVIANLRHVDISFKDLHKSVEQVPATCKIKGKLKGLAGKFKHDIQGAKDNAVSAWKLCDTALREARKAKSSAARKDGQASPSSPRKDAMEGRNLIAKTYAFMYADDTITALADVEYEAKMILGGAGDAKKLVNQSLSTRLKNKGILEIKGVQAHIKAITKLCDDALKVGNEILRIAEAESGRLKKEKENAASRKDAAFKIQGKKTFVLRKDGAVRIDTEYKSFGMEPSSSSPLPAVEKKLQFARSEIQMKVHKALLSGGAGKHPVSCTSLKLSGSSLPFRLFIDNIRGADFKEDKMRKVDVKSIVSSVLGEYFGRSAVGGVSASIKFNKGTHDPRIAPRYSVEWDVNATLKVASRRTDSSAEVAQLLKAHGISFSSSTRYPNGVEFSAASLRDKALEIIYTSLPHLPAMPEDIKDRESKKTYFLIVW